MEDLCKDIRSVIDSINNKVYEKYFGQLFPNYTLDRVLTPGEMLRFLARIQVGTTVNLNGYIVAVQELRNDERAEKLAASTPTAVNPAVVDATQPSTSSAEPANVPAVCDPVSSAPVIAAPAPPAPTPEEIKREELTAKLQAALDSSEHEAWNYAVDKNGKLQSTICSYLIHKKEYELVEFMMKDPNYYRGWFVSGELASQGDLDGLKWIRSNLELASGTWSSNIVISKATSFGHLPVLVWMNRNKLDTSDRLGQWQSAVAGKHLHIIQWYFIAFPDSAQNLAHNMFRYAKDKSADNIVEWLISVGLGPVD